MRVPRIGLATSPAGSRPLLDCPVCGRQPGTSWLRQSEWEILRCSRCELAMTWPRPSADLLAEIYSSRDYYATREMDDEASQATITRAREILAHHSRPVRRVLDFGAGEGHLVAAFRSLGIEAEGVEPSAAGRREARRRYDLDLREDLFTGRPDPVDLVVLLHSLEHVPDPVGVLRSLGEWIHPDGTLFIEVPNAGSFEMRRTEGRKKILDVPVHLFHFTPETLSRVVEAAGLRVSCVQLTNPEWLESILNARAAALSKSTVPTHAPGRPSAGGTGSSSKLRKIWREGLLPRVRSILPGWKFQMIATLADAS